jgi:hypothetical protein
VSAGARSARRSRLRPVLLCALGFPGLGQLAQRRYGAAALHALASLALVLLLLGRLYTETNARIPRDPEQVLTTLQENPAWPLQLAREIERDNAGFFGWLFAGIAALWALSIADAWRASRVPEGLVERTADPRVQ